MLTLLQENDICYVGDIQNEILHIYSNTAIRYLLHLYNAYVYVIYIIDYGRWDSRYFWKGARVHSRFIDDGLQPIELFVDCMK